MKGRGVVLTIPFTGFLQSLLEFDLLIGINMTQSTGIASPKLVDHLCTIHHCIQPISGAMVVYQEGRCTLLIDMGHFVVENDYRLYSGKGGRKGSDSTIVMDDTATTNRNQDKRDEKTMIGVTPADNPNHTKRSGNV